MKTLIIPVIGPILAGPDNPHGLNKIREVIGGYAERVTVGDPLSHKPFGTYHCWVTMLVNEDGVSQGLPLNPRASYLYGVSLHGATICGSVVLVGEHLGKDGVDFTLLPEDYAQPGWWNKFFIDRLG